MFPSNYTRAIFVAEHGSGTKKFAIGYRISQIVAHPNGTAISHSIFAQGWLQKRHPKQFWGEFWCVSACPRSRTTPLMSGLACA